MQFLKDGVQTVTSEPGILNEPQILCKDTVYLLLSAC